MPTYLSFHRSRPKKISHNANLVSACVPDTLEVTVPLGEAVHAVVALAHGADEAAKSVDLVLASVTAVLVNLGDGDLDRAVVLGLDDAVGRAALAGDVPAQEKPQVSINALFLASLGLFGARWADAGVSAAFGGALTGRQARRGRSPF